MEDYREDEHEVDGIAHSDDIVEKRAVWDAEIGIKVGEDVVKGGFAEKEEAE